MLTLVALFTLAHPPLAPGAYAALKGDLVREHAAVSVDVARVAATLRDGGCFGATFVNDTRVRRVQRGNAGRLYVPVRAHGRDVKGGGCYVTGFVEVLTPVSDDAAQPTPTWTAALSPLSTPLTER
jgi:hypothetical protein